MSRGCGPVYLPLLSFKGPESLKMEGGVFFRRGLGRLAPSFIPVKTQGECSSGFCVAGLPPASSDRNSRTLFSCTSLVPLLHFYNVNYVPSCGGRERPLASLPFV